MIDVESPSDTQPDAQRFTQDGVVWDVVVVGATPGGIACAVRAAREGLRVLIVSRYVHLGGMLSNGLGVMDTLFDGRRAPLYDEVCDRILDHYRTAFGPESEQYTQRAPGPREYSSRRLKFEPHVGEKVLNDILAGESLITVLKPYHPFAVERAERRLGAVHVRQVHGDDVRRVAARVFVDATYEGDLAALAGVPYRVGREGRQEHGEPHAGRIFCNQFLTPDDYGLFPREAAAGRLNLRPYRGVTQQLFAGSTGEGDGAIQAYNWRLSQTSDPENSRYPEEPDGYDRGRYVDYLSTPPSLRPQIGTLPGVNHAYPCGDLETRESIEKAHRDYTLGFLYFLQNDEAVPAEERARARGRGLAKNEFTDNDNWPWEIYVREARRIWGRYTFTEHDGTLAPGLERAPIHEDAIAIAEWPMDSHACTTETRLDSMPDGKILLSELTRPSQVPYRCLLPEDVDNLLVPVCLSATHVGWGTLRLEPVWMHVGESVGHAIALAAELDTTPGELSGDLLQRRLVERGVMVSFFNDLDMATDALWVPAVQYLGTKGFFASYDAQPAAPLLAGEAHEWARAAGELLAGAGDANSRARMVWRNDQPGDQTRQGDIGTTTAGFVRMLTATMASQEQITSRVEEAVEACLLELDASLSRGDACRLIYHVLSQ